MTPTRRISLNHFIHQFVEADCVYFTLSGLRSIYGNSNEFDDYIDRDGTANITAIVTDFKQLNVKQLQEHYGYLTTHWKELTLDEWQEVLSLYAEVYPSGYGTLIVQAF